MYDSIILPHPISRTQKRKILRKKTSQTPSPANAKKNLANGVADSWFHDALKRWATLNCFNFRILSSLKFPNSRIIRRCVWKGNWHVPLKNVRSKWHPRTLLFIWRKNVNILSVKIVTEWNKSFYVTNKRSIGKWYDFRVSFLWYQGKKH
jgi:hypothetical protein